MAQGKHAYIQVFTAIRFKAVDGGYRFLSASGEKIEIPLVRLVSIEEIEAQKSLRVCYINYSVNANAKGERITSKRFTNLVQIGCLHFNPSFYTE